MKQSNSKRRISDYVGMGTLIGFCAAIGILLGVITGSPESFVFWLAGGAALGVVIGAIIETYRKRKNTKTDE